MLHGGAKARIYKHQAPPCPYVILYASAPGAILIAVRHKPEVKSDDLLFLWPTSFVAHYTQFPAVKMPNERLIELQHIRTVLGHA